MSEIKIDKNVPVPTSRYKYPFTQMKKGDSFLVATKELAVGLRVLAAQYSRRYAGVKFSVRKHEGAYRCWRIA